MPDFLISIAVVVAVLAALWWIDRRNTSRRHHDHLIPGTPRRPRRAP